MSIVNTLKNLRTNLFGGPGNTGFSQPPPSKVQGIGMTGTPTSSLDSDPMRFGTYQFPKDIFENQQLGHYMVFYVNVQDRSKYYYGGTDGYEGSDAAFASAEDSANGTGLRSLRDRLKIVNNKVTGNNLSSDKQDLRTSERNSAALQGFSSVRKTTSRIKDSIALYLPADVKDTTGANYEDTPTGILGVGLTNIVGAVNAFNEDDFEATGKLGANVLKDTFGEILRNLGGGLAESLTGAEGAIPLANKIFGRADNPFIEVFFNSMNIRTFTSNFNFAPRNEAETLEVQQIIQLFRFHMAPDLQEVNSRYLTLPSEFDIHYMYKAANGVGYENDYYGRIGTCVLENVTTNHTPNGVKSFADGAPTQITMALTFRETEALTKEKINQGY